MTETLPVHVNRTGTYSVEADPSFRATGTFAVAVHNHGSPTHVHLRLDGPLSEVASVGTPNRYVEGDGPNRVTVTVESDLRPVTGTLRVLTGYGKEEAEVAIEVVEPDEPDVDESLSEPPAAESGTGGRPAAERLAASGPVVALTALAGLLAVVAVFVTGDLAVAAGAVAVLVGIGAAAVFLRGSA